MTRGFPDNILMKYFYDTEFLEGTQNKTFLGMNVGKTKPTIDLISIGIVSDEVKYIGGVDPIAKDEKVHINKYSISREYYAISKDFNLKEAWSNKWQRDNILKPIWLELKEKEAYENNNSEYKPYFCNTLIRKIA